MKTVKRIVPSDLNFLLIDVDRIRDNYPCLCGECDYISNETQSAFDLFRNSLMADIGDLKCSEFIGSYVVEVGYIFTDDDILGCVD